MLAARSVIQDGGTTIGGILKHTYRKEGTAFKLARQRKKKVTFFMSAAAKKVRQCRLNR
jgi:hypothetical protein